MKLNLDDKETNEENDGVNPMIRRKNITTMLVFCALASLTSSAAYVRGGLLWRCDFTPEETVKYRVSGYRPDKDGYGITYFPSEGKNGDGAFRFKTLSAKYSAGVNVNPDVAISGLVQIEADVKGVDIGESPQHFLGPKVLFAFTPKPGAKTVHPQLPIERGSFDWKTWIKVQNIPETAQDFSFFLGLQNTPGEFWIDSVRVYRAKEIPDEAVVPPVNEAAKRIPRGRYAKTPRRGGRRGAMIGRDMTEESIANFADVWGANLVRLPICYLGEHETMDGWFAALEKKLDYCKGVMDICHRHGVKVIVDLHQGPKCKMTKHGSNVLWPDYDATDLCRAWKMIATRFRNHPATYAYDILNEPSVGPETWKRVCLEVMADVRKIDKKTPFMMESVKHWYEGENVIYSPHFYSPHTLTHFGVMGSSNVRWSYPGYIDGVYWDKEQMRVALKDYIDFQEAHPGAKMCVGEFSCILWAKGADKYIRDAIEIFEEYGWDWCYHAYREWPAWSVEYTHAGDYEIGKWVKATADTDRKKELLNGLSRNRRKGMRKK